MNPVSSVNSVEIGSAPPAQKREVLISPNSNSSISTAPVASSIEGSSTKAPDNNDTKVAKASDTVKQLQDNVDTANARLASANQRVDLSVDQDTGQVVVKVSDTSTGEVLSQIPSENSLKLAKSLDSLTGILVDKKS